MTATTACRTCGTEPRQGARFCDGCGAPVTAHDTHAEFKQVTVLFADVVHSMDIAAAVGAERLREIMADLSDRCAVVMQRYGSTVAQWTGDGIMAVFGAPIALEDHAVRACLAALGLQEEATRLAVEVGERDGIDLRLRVGLNSGEVIAGGFGSGPFGYATVGEQVGMAQRMESVAPPGGVMLSVSTARLVEGAASLGELELVRIKGAAEPVPARRLVGMGDGHRAVGRGEPTLVGRRWEMAAVEALVDRAIGGGGAVVNVVGPPGIGKSRLVREVTAMAAARGVDVFTTFCESHASQVPFHAVAQLLRAATGVEGRDGQTARDRVRDRFPAADPEDLLLMHDLMGLADAEAELPKIDPDARRRRLTALVNAASLARTEPAVYVIEDAHWIDEVSEAMIAEFVTVIPQTPSLVLITYRPEYRGALSEVAGAHTVTLAPLSDSETTALVSQLLGPDPSVCGLGQTIAERAAGNPFFAEEIVRELGQRGVLTGEHGKYVCRVDVAEVSVPATVQAAIEARIDRLNSGAKRTLNAASVIGARFEAGLFAALGLDAVVDELLGAELIDQVRFTPCAEYAFRHPLIRAVAYESQLKSDRAQWHRRLAAAIEEHEPGAVEQNAALIGEHLQAAGELHAAYGWHMRAGAWSANRDVGAARVSWERACRIADRLPDDDPDQLSMRIAPRTMLRATDNWQIRAFEESRGRFAELRELCSAAEDKVSLAIGMSGLVTELLYSGRSREGSRVASEQTALLESIGDPNLTIGLAFVALATWFDAGEFGEILRWSQTVIDLAGGDPAKGAGFGGMGSPLAAAVAFRGVARWWLGRPGWRQDVHDAVAMAQNTDPATLSLILYWTYCVGIRYGVLRADDSALRAMEEVVRTAQSSGNDLVVSFAEFTLGGALLYRNAAADRHRGLELIVQAREWARERIPYLVPATEVLAARERARRGDRDAAIPMMRKSVHELHQAGRIGLGVSYTGVLVETLLERGAEGDLAEAQEAIDRLANLRANQGWAMREITLLRLRALLACARRDEDAYRDFRDRYRDMAKTLGYEGHIAWAEALP
jgi:class 3 adenylate cyclase